MTENVIHVYLFVEQPVNIFSLTNLTLEISTSLIPNKAVVNDVEVIRILNSSERQVMFGPLGAIVLTCEVLPGYENPYWEVRDNSRFVNLIQNQTITNVTGNEIATVNVNSSSSTSVLTILIPPELEFPDDLIGTYTCRASNSDAYSSVILTNSESHSHVYLATQYYNNHVEVVTYVLYCMMSSLQQILILLL